MTGLSDRTPSRSSLEDDGTSWFHGKIAREEAEGILCSGQEGQFLVRESTTALGDYVLSLVHNNEPVHYQIRKHGDDAFFSIDEGPIIHGLDTLIENYQQGANGLCTKLGKTFRGKPPPAECRRHGRTNLLHRATRAGETLIVTELLNSGYHSLDAKNQDGQTALHLASYKGHDDILVKLIDSGSSTNLRDSQGLTALHYACQMNRPTTIRILIDRGGANVQTRASKDGWVALHEAASRGFIECIKVLLASNAPGRPRTNDGKFPYDLAISNGHTECAEILDKYEPPAPKTKVSEWFHGNVSREKAQTLLNKEGSDGRFLVRQGSRKPGVYVLSMLHQGQSYHFEIQRDDRFHYIDDGPYLDSVEHLIEHYSRMPDGLPAKLDLPLSPGSALFTLSVLNPVCNGINISRTPSPDEHWEPLGIRRLDVTEIRRESLLLGIPIGEGEFGSVLSGCYIDPTGRKIDVAIKTLREEHVFTGSREFLREASVMESMNHPCVVKLVGVSVGPPLMMVQEVFPLGAMLEYLQDYRETIDPGIELPLWASQIADGMMYLESRRFVHRDLASRNILMQSRVQVKITDFGLSRALGVGSEYYRASQGGRWPVKWYAPESVNYGTFSHASDVWSYGVTLWEMYSFGCHPYEGMTGAQVIQFLENNQRLSRPEQCMEKVYALMLQCWVYKPSERPTFKYLHGFFNSTGPSNSRPIVSKSLVI